MAMALAMATAMCKIKGRPMQILKPGAGQDHRQCPWPWPLSVSQPCRCKWPRPWSMRMAAMAWPMAIRCTLLTSTSTTAGRTKSDLPAVMLVRSARPGRIASSSPPRLAPLARLQVIVVVVLLVLLPMYTYSYLLLVTARLRLLLPHIYHHSPDHAGRQPTQRRRRQLRAR